MNDLGLPIAIFCFLFLLELTSILPHLGNGPGLRRKGGEGAEGGGEGEEEREEQGREKQRRKEWMEGKTK